MMLPARTAIARTRRSITLGTLVKALLWAAALSSLIFASQLPFDGRAALFVVILVWVVLSVRSWQSTRLNADIPHLLATGEFDAAERQIDRSLRAFSLFRPVKLVALHQLAVLRMAQGRFGETTLICRELLGQRLGLLSGLSRSSRMMLAQALLAEGDAAGAAGPLASLRHEQLSLAETMNLLQLDLDYQSRGEHWAPMFDDYMGKVQLAEVMPAGAGARVQALLALAARKVGREDAADWLARRAALLIEPSVLVRQRPILAELWPSATAQAERPAEPSATDWSDPPAGNASGMGML